MERELAIDALFPSFLVPERYAFLLKIPTLLVFKPEAMCAAADVSAYIALYVNIQRDKSFFWYWNLNTDFLLFVFVTQFKPSTGSRLELLSFMISFISADWQ